MGGIGGVGCWIHVNLLTPHGSKMHTSVRWWCPGSTTLSVLCFWCFSRTSLESCRSFGVLHGVVLRFVWSFFPVVIVRGGRVRAKVKSLLICFSMEWFPSHWRPCNSCQNKDCYSWQLVPTSFEVDILKEWIGSCRWMVFLVIVFAVFAGSLIQCMLSMNRIWIEYVYLQLVKIGGHSPSLWYSVYCPDKYDRRSFSCWYAAQLKVKGKDIRSRNWFQCPMLRFRLLW